MLTFLKKIFTKTVSIAIFVVMFVICVIFSDKILVQVSHIKAFYYVHKGDNFYHRGDFQKAITHYNYALRLYPEHVKARYNLGNIYVAYEDYNSAVDCYYKALQYNPDFINARINLGIILSQELLDYDTAIEQYQKAVNSEPIIVSIPFVFDNAKNMKIGKAVANYDMGLAYKSKALLYAQDPFQSRNFVQKAAESYEKAVRIEPINYDSHYNLALAYHILGEYKKAMREYCTAIEIEPYNYEAHYNLAILLSTLSKFDYAVGELEKAILILDLKGNDYKQRYIHGVLNEVTQKALIRKQYTDSFLEIKKADEAQKTDKEKEEDIKDCRACKELLED